MGMPASVFSHNDKTAHPAAVVECAVDKPALCRVVNLYNWTYANEGILLCLGLGLLLLDLLGVAALRVCIRLGFHFVICISARNPCFGEGRGGLFIPDNLFNFSHCRLRFGLLIVCGGFIGCISKQLIKSIHYFRRNSNHSGEDGIGVT